MVPWPITMPHSLQLNKNSSTVLQYNPFIILLNLRIESIPKNRKKSTSSKFSWHSVLLKPFSTLFLGTTASRGRQLLFSPFHRVQKQLRKLHGDWKNKKQGRFGTWKQSSLGTFWHFFHFWQETDIGQKKKNWHRCSEKISPIQENNFIQSQRERK